MPTTTAAAVTVSAAPVPAGAPTADATVTAVATAVVGDGHGGATVVRKPVVILPGQALPTTVEQLRAAAGLPAEDVAVDAQGSVTGVAPVAASAPVRWKDPADSPVRTLGVLGTAAAAVGAFCWLLLRRRRDEPPPRHR